MPPGCDVRNKGRGFWRWQYKFDHIPTGIAMMRIWQYSGHDTGAVLAFTSYTHRSYMIFSINLVDKNTNVL